MPASNRPDNSVSDLLAGEQPASPATENVGRGLAFSLLALACGAVVAAIVYQTGFIVSFTSALTTWAAVSLYTKGAGAAPRKGALALVLVIVAGVLTSLFAMLGTNVYFELAEQYPSLPATDLLEVVFANLFDPELWSYFARDAAFFVIFAALGTFSSLRRLHIASKAGA